MKKGKVDIPVYDLHEFKPKKLHDGVSAGSFIGRENGTGQTEVPHRHNYYHITLFTRGHGTNNIDFEQFHVHGGQIYFMVPGQVHSCNFITPDGYTVSFDENIFNGFMQLPQHLEQFPFLRGIPKDSVIELQNGALDEAAGIFKQIVDEVNKKDEFSMHMVCFYLMALFICVSRQKAIPVKGKITERNQVTLLSFRNLVNEHYMAKKLPKEYAAMLFITPGQLNVLCKNLLGKPAGEIIRERILLEAKRLLVNADISISEIAFKLNFKDNSYFTKFFKNNAGVTPENFKASYFYNR